MNNKETKSVNSYFEIAKVVGFLRKKISNLEIEINDKLVPWVGLKCSGISSKDMRGL